MILYQLNQMSMILIAVCVGPVMTGMTVKARVSDYKQKTARLGGFCSKSVVACPMGAGQGRLMNEVN